MLECVDFIVSSNASTRVLTDRLHDELDPGGYLLATQGERERKMCKN